MILELCERFGCLPSALLAEEASILQLINIELMGRDDG